MFGNDPQKKLQGQAIPKSKMVMADKVRMTYFDQMITFLKAFLKYARISCAAF